MSSILAGLTGLYDMVAESVKILVTLSTPTTPTTHTPSHTQLPDIEMDATVCADDIPKTSYNFKTGEIVGSFTYVFV
jgi:hypothetical protein